MAKIAVFDSGLGSLSIIRAIQKHTKCHIVYFADQKNYPYGKKSKQQLTRIIKNTISFLNERFEPDFIVIGSNTPTIILNIQSPKIFGIAPPIRKASKITKTKNIAILATKTTIYSRSLASYIKQSGISKNIKIHKINCSALVDLVESGTFLTSMTQTNKTISTILSESFKKHNIDTATLSSTHLPFLKKNLEKQFPDVTFVDPADDTAKDISKLFKPSRSNRLNIYSSSKTKIFEKNLRKLGIKNKITFL